MLFLSYLKIFFSFVMYLFLCYKYIPTSDMYFFGSPRAVISTESCNYPIIEHSKWIGIGNTYIEPLSNSTYSCKFICLSAKQEV